MSDPVLFVDAPSPNKSSRGGFPIGMIVMHADAGTTDGGTVAWIQNPESKVSYHYMVGRVGQVYRFVADDMKAWHAGKSEWNGASVHGSLNPVSIGVCVANNGTEQYADIQYKLAGKLVAHLMRKYSVGLHDVRGHHEVSPGRKTDPYDHFDWRAFYGHVGMFAAGR